MTESFSPSTLILSTKIKQIVALDLKTLMGVFYVCVRLKARGNLLYLCFVLSLKAH